MVKAEGPRLSPPFRGTRCVGSATALSSGRRGMEPRSNRSPNDRGRLFPLARLIVLGSVWIACVRSRSCPSQPYPYPASRRALFPVCAMSLSRQSALTKVSIEDYNIVTGRHQQVFMIGRAVGLRLSETEIAQVLLVNSGLPNSIQYGVCHPSA